MLILRDYQRDCIEAVNNSLRAGNKKVLCALAVSSGKTAIAGSIIKQYLEKNPYKRVVFLSHLSILVDQTGQSFFDHWDIKSDILQAQELPMASSRCIISTIQSFKNEDKINDWASKMDYYSSRDIKALNVGMIFIDEQHYAFKSNTHKKIEQMFPDADYIGLTATPIKENRLITEYFDDVPYTLSSQELIDLGYCVPPELKILNVNPLNQDDLYSSILSSYENNHKGQKAIIFLRTIRECEDASQLFNMYGINSIAITSKYTGKNRNKTLDDFRSNKKGSPMVLTTVNVLTAGFDSPNVEVIYMPYPVDSVVSYIQRVGRGLRICPEINKTKCIVYAASKTPKLEKGKWIEMNNTLLGVSKKKKENNYLSDLDYSLLSEVKRKWTLSVVKMAKGIEKKGLKNLSSMIINKKFPEDLLDIMKDMPICKPYKYSNVKATPAQVKVLKRYEINHNVTKQEASILIDGIAKKEKWKIPEWEIVQTGLHKGKQWKDVPYMYIKSLPWGHETKREWNLYRAKIRALCKK